MKSDDQYQYVEQQKFAEALIEYKNAADAMVTAHGKVLQNEQWSFDSCELALVKSCIRRNPNHRTYWASPSHLKKRPPADCGRRGTVSEHCCAQPVSMLNT